LVLLTESVGNHSNRLFQHIHIDSYFRNKNITFYNPTLYDIAKNYRLKNKYSITRNKILYFIIKILIKLTIIKPVILTNDLKPKFLTFIKDSSFRNDTISLNDKNYYKEIFSLSKDINNETLANFNKDSIKIGIHIRRGDYKTWNNGIYYYSDEQYIKIIQQVLSLFDKNTSLYLFSNENLDENKYKNSLGDSIYFSKNEYYADHYLMSICDYLIGPPSTFTAFASFIGNAKFYHINDIEKKISLSDFRISNG